MHYFHYNLYVIQQREAAEICSCVPLIGRLIFIYVTCAMSEADRAPHRVRRTEATFCKNAITLPSYAVCVYIGKTNII